MVWVERSAVGCERQGRCGGWEGDWGSGSEGALAAARLLLDPLRAAQAERGRQAIGLAKGSHARASSASSKTSLWSRAAHRMKGVHEHHARLGTMHVAVEAAAGPRAGCRGGLVLLQEAGTKALVGGGVGGRAA